jgi:antitoxin ParD1/3/4
MNITLPPQLEALVQQKVASGMYGDASEVVGEALRLLEERDRLTRLRAALAVGDDQLARGEVVEWTPGLMERLKREADAEERQGLPISDDVTPEAARRQPGGERHSDTRDGRGVNDSAMRTPTSFPMP